MVSNKFNI